jgi:hypothetical protein
VTAGAAQRAVLNGTIPRADAHVVHSLSALRSRVAKMGIGRADDVQPRKNKSIPGASVRRTTSR